MHLKQAKAIVAGCVAALALSVLGWPTIQAAPGQPQVVFVCEHGNRSLMAASYFNALATARGVSIRAISRGTAPSSTGVPSSIATGLQKEGFDVSGFRSVKVSEADVRDAVRLVVIQAAVPEAVQATTVIESWDDIPAPGADYAAASQALRKRIEQLMDQLLSTHK